MHTIGYSPASIVAPHINRFISILKIASIVKRISLFTTVVVLQTSVLSAFSPIENHPDVAATAVLSGGGDLCFNGPGDSLTVTFTGTGPFTFVYSANGVPQAPITTSLQVYKIFINPVMYTKYQLVSLTAQGMPGTVSGIAEVFVFVSSNATLSGDLTFCDGVSTTLLVNLTGTAPFTLTYSINGQIQPPVTVQDGPILIPANVTQTTVYRLISIESPGCLEAETDSQTLFINYAPTYSNLAFNCNPMAGNYTVSFDILGGTPPYTLVDGTGTFFGNQFVSQPIPSANGYNISFHDANNCGNVVISGPSTCNCTTDAGTVNTVPVTLCEGQTASTTHNMNQVLDGNDVLRYILHTTPSLPVGQILAWSNTPNFPWTAAIQPGVTYYISAIAGNDDGAGQVSLNDICLSVSPGKPVVWQALPTAVAGSDVNVCAGTNIQLPVQFTGSGPFNLTYSINGQSFTENGLQAPFSLSNQISTNATIILTQVSDANCTAIITDTALVKVHSAPVAGLPVITCDVNQGIYTIGLNIISGDTASINIAGLPGFYNNQTGQFNSSPVPETDSFKIFITDQWLCGADTLAGVSNCQCTTDAGMLAGDTMRLCYNTPVNLVPVTGSNFLTTDTLLYVIAQSTSLANPGIIAQSGTSVIPFPTGPAIPGVVYYAMAVAGKKGGTGGIDLNDPCLDFSNAIPVIWTNNITAAVTGNNTICAGQSAAILVQLAGSTSYTYGLYANGTLYQSITNQSGPLNFYTVTPTTTTVFEVKNLTAAGCPGVAVSTGTVTVNPVPEIVGLQQICDADNLHYVLQFGISNGSTIDETYSVTGITGAFLSDTVFVSDAYQAGTPYTITVSSPSGCSSTISGSGTCECATKVGTITPLVTDACTDGMVSALFANNAVLDPNDTLLFFICDDPAAIPQSILATSNTPVFGFLPGMSVETTYYIFAAAGNLLPSGTIDYSDPCTSLSGGVGVEFHDAPSLVMNSVDTTICKGQNFQIPITLIGSPPFKFKYKLNGLIFPEITTNLPAYLITSSNIQSEQLIEVVSFKDANCSGTISGTVHIQVKEQPVLKISGTGTVCPGQPVTLTLQLDHATSASVEILSNTGPSLTFPNVQGSFTFTVSPATTTTYTIGNVVFTGNDCPGVIQGIAKVVIAPVVVDPLVSSYSGYGISCHGATDGSIALMPTGGNGQYTYLWDNGTSGAMLSGLTPGTYAFTITDQSGCSTTGSEEITTPEPLDFKVSIVAPLCPGNNNGSITLESVSGGVGPYNLEVDHTTGVPVFNLPQVIGTLTAGSYSLQITDANGCTDEQMELVPDPPQLVVSLGEDQTLFIGDSVWLVADVNAADVVKYVWTPVSMVAPKDSSSVLSWPIRTTTYQVTVTNSEGCTASDEIQIAIQRANNVFVPNIITPDEGGENGIMTIYGGHEILSVKYLRIYDRWGELLFEKQQFLPNDRSQGWDGTWNNKPVQPGVYYYVLEVEKYGGIQEVLKGDVTVIR